MEPTSLRHLVVGHLQCVNLKYLQSESLSKGIWVNQGWNFGENCLGGRESLVRLQGSGQSPNFPFQSICYGRK